MPDFAIIISIAVKIVFILFFFGFCIFIHEFGHLIVAMWRGLHIEKFSVGFGKPIVQWRRNNIDYLISYLPFGGYVALPQLDPSDTPKTSQGEPLPLTKPLDRILTAFAGPLFNIFFGFFLACIIWKVGIEGPAPSKSFVIGYMPESYTAQDGTKKPNPEYESGLQAGDEITAVNGETFSKGWQEALELIVYSPDGRATLDVVRNGEQMKFSYNLASNPEFEGLGYPFMGPLLPTTIGEVFDDSPAMRAGLRKDDILFEINGEKVINAGILIERIQQASSRPITLKIIRENKELTIPNIVAEKKSIDGEDKFLIGIQIITSRSERVIYYPTPVKQFTDVITRTFKTFRGLFDKKNPIQAKHMSGPVGIFHMLYVMVSHAGFIAALNFIILISFSLAIINLFPLPILDGGHILLGIIEMISGRRIPAKLMTGLSYMFIVILLTFMLYVTCYDVKRVSKSFYQNGKGSIEADPNASDALPNEKKASPTSPGETP